MRLLSGYTKPVVALAITPDGSRLYTVAKRHALVWEWDLATGEVARKFKTPLGGWDLHALAVSPDGASLACVAEFHGVALMSLGPGGVFSRLADETAQDRTSQAPPLEFDPTGSLLLAPFVRWPADFGFLGFDVTRRVQVRRWSGLGGYVNDIRFSPFGQLIAAASDNFVRVWDREEDEALFVLEHPWAPDRVAFGPLGRYLAAAGGNSLQIWNASTGKSLATGQGHAGPVTALQYSPNGKYLASAGHDGVVILRDAETSEVVGQKHLDIGKINAMVWCADSASLVAGGEKLIAVTEVVELMAKEGTKRPRGEPLSLAGHRRKIEGLAYSPDGKTLASWEEAALRTWDLSAGAGQAKEKGRFSARTRGTPSSVNWSRDGRRLAVVSFDEGRLLDAEAGTTLQHYHTEGVWVAHLSCTPTGRLLLITQQDSTRRMCLRLLDPEKAGEEIHRQETDRPCGTDCMGAFAFGQDERVYANIDDREVWRWTPGSGDFVPITRQSSRLSGMAATDDERLLITLGGNTAHVWNLPDGAKKLELKHPLQVSGLAAVSGNRVLTACNDGEVRLWDLGGGTELFAFDLGMGKIHSLAASPDGMTFAAGVHKNRRIVLMDVPD